jgi:hypothetical protein
MLSRRMKLEDATVHGFRSSFRDWARKPPALRAVGLINLAKTAPFCLRAVANPPVFVAN